MKLGAYDIIRPIGSGGMSDAFLARSPTGRIAVLKKPKSRDPEIVARMRDEGRLGMKLYHESLVETLDMFEFEGYPVLALGFVEGVTVDELRKKTAIAPDGVARIGCQIAEALGAIHGALGDDGSPMRAVHRDVSARNILVTPKGGAVLIDLGIARTDEQRVAHTETGMVLGTLRYMAPELIDGKGATPTSDFYSLGCVLIEAVSGRSVFEGPPSEVAAQIVAKGPMAAAAAGALAPPLRDVVARMVAMRPEDRIAEAHELSAALRSVEAQLGGGARTLAERARDATQALPSPEGTPAPVTGVSLPTPVGGGARPVDPATATFDERHASMIAQQSSLSSPFAPPTSASSVFTSTPHARTEPMMPAVNIPTAAPPPPSLPPRPMPSLAQPLAQPVSQQQQGLTAAPSLELAVEPRRRVNTVDVPTNPRDWYPKHKKDYRWLSAAATKVGVGVVVVGALFAAYRWYAGKEADDEASRVAAKAAEEARLLREAMGDTAAPNAGCDQPGAVWVYTDKHGADVIVDSLSKIPAKERAKARCAVPSR